MGRPEQIAVPDGLCSPESRLRGACPDKLRNWFRVENLIGNDTGTVDIVIDGLIVDPFMAEMFGLGVSSTEVVDQILALRGRPLNVWINSDGGLIGAGLAIYNQLLLHDAPVTTIVHGAAMSIASVIAMAGSTVIMAPTTHLFIHEASGELDGTAADHQQLSVILNQLSDQIAAVYARRGDSRVNWRAKMQAGSGPLQGTLITAEEAVRLKLADRIDAKLARQPMNAIDLKGFTTAPVFTALLDEAVGVHHTDTTDAAWDDAAQRKNARSGEDEAYYRDIFAWQDPDKDPATKDAWSFTHHMVNADGEPGAANMTACSTGIGTLNGGRIEPGDETPWMADRDGIYAHLAAHLRDGDREPPDLQPRDEVSLTPTKRDAEQALRDAGFSAKEAKALLADRWQDVLAARDERNDEPPGSTGTVEPDAPSELVASLLLAQRVMASHGLVLTPGG